jgi:hypothetical protein
MTAPVMSHRPRAYGGGKPGVKAKRLNVTKLSATEQLFEDDTGLAEPLSATSTPTPTPTSPRLGAYPPLYIGSGATGWRAAPSTTKCSGIIAASSSSQLSLANGAARAGQMHPHDESVRSAVLPPRASAIPPAKSYASSSSNVRPRARGGGRGGGRSSVKYYREEEGGPPQSAEDGEGWNQEDQEFYEEMGDGWDWGCVKWRSSPLLPTYLAKPMWSPAGDTNTQPNLGNSGSLTRLILATLSWRTAAPGSIETVCQYEYASHPPMSRVDHPCCTQLVCMLMAVAPNRVPQCARSRWV